MTEQQIMEAERYAKDLVEILYEETIDEADCIYVDRKWYLERVIHYMRIESEK